MPIVNHNLSEDAIEIYKHKYYSYIDNDNTFWHCLHRKYEYNKQSIKPFVEIIKSWMFDCPYEYKINGKCIEFGNYKRDKWIYYYNWTTCQFGQIYQTIMTDEERQAKVKSDLVKQKQFCIKHGLDFSKVGTDYVNKELPDVKIKWEGITLDRRKYCISFYDYKAGRSKDMSLAYFKSNYYGG